jgi:hypothetical protein
MTFHGKANPLATSLKQIRAEQKASREALAEIGLNTPDDHYSYRRVGTPD